jgi:hypothetical protein
VEVAEAREARRSYAAGFSEVVKLGKSTDLTQESRELVDKTLHLFDTIPWSGTLNGFSTSFPVHLAARFLTTQWLTDDNEDILIDLLSQEIHLSKTTADLQVILPGQTGFFAGKLISAFLEKDVYGSGKGSGYNWIGRLGEELASGRKHTWGFIAHVKGNHWVAVVIDALLGVIWYGDPMGDVMDGQLEDAVKWWAEHHLATPFTVMEMDVLKQCDGYSCGVLAWLALRDCVLDEGGKVRQMKVWDERMRIFINVIKRHDNNVSSALSG